MRTKRGFLFPVKALSKVFRGKFVAALKLARDNGKLPGPGLADDAWGDLIARLYAHDWVVYAKQPLGGPAQVLEYLGRYTHRVAISNERIVGMDEDSVSLRVRDWTQGNRRRTLRLPAHTFIERFLLHVLPTGFKRIRHYGLLGPARKALKLAQARAALSVPATRSRGGGVGGRVHVPHRPTRVGALWALRAGMLCAHRTHCGIEGAPAPAARTALKSVAGTDCVEPAWRLGSPGIGSACGNAAAALAAVAVECFRPRNPTSARKTPRCTSPAVTSAMPSRLTQHRADLQSP